MQDSVAVRTAPASAQNFLRVGEHELAYSRSGHGPDLVFVHGWPLHAATFRNIVPLLQNDYTCHLIDLPCAGQSRSAAGAAVGFKDQIEVLRGVIDALGLTRFSYVAHDSGGMLARYAAAGDARVRGLVLGNTELPKHVPSSVMLLSLLQRVPGGAEMFRAAMRNRAFRFSSQGFGPVLEQRKFLEGEFDQLFLEPIFATPAATRRTLSVLRTYSELCDGLSAAHAQLRAPATLIWGEADTLFSISGARAMLPEFAAGAELEVIPGGKLFAHEEHPADFARIARSYLARLH